MAYSGNVRVTGNARIDLEAGAASITTSSGQITSIVDNGVGDVTLTLDTERRFSPRATVKVTPIGAATPALSRCVLDPAGLTIQVLLFDNLGAAEDADFGITIWEHFIG